ncbi:hypothetical protein ACH4VT_33635 [Streptomyces lydicus]|uniref:hypothetical protein n=1 Tax=Streptomyces lydicus TaxID=47763 RepID=UPI00378EF15D
MEIEAPITDSDFEFHDSGAITAAPGLLITITDYPCVLFTGARFDGTSQPFDVGEHTGSALELPAGAVRSVFVGPGFQATLYTEEGFTGDSTVVHGNGAHVGQRLAAPVASLKVTPQVA